MVNGQISLTLVPELFPREWVEGSRPGSLWVPFQCVWSGSPWWSPTEDRDWTCSPRRCCGTFCPCGRTCRGSLCGGRDTSPSWRSSPSGRICTAPSCAAEALRESKDNPHRGCIYPPCRRRIATPPSKINHSLFSFVVLTSISMSWTTWNSSSVLPPFT